MTNLDAMACAKLLIERRILKISSLSIFPNENMKMQIELGSM
jgi:hypothetical protein